MDQKPLTYYFLTDISVELLEHLRLGVVPFQTIAFPLGDPCRETLHEWENLDQKCTRYDSTSDASGVCVNPCDEWLVLAADSRPSVNSCGDVGSSRSVICVELSAY